MNPKKDLDLKKDLGLPDRDWEGNPLDWRENLSLDDEDSAMFSNERKASLKIAHYDANKNVVMTSHGLGQKLKGFGYNVYNTDNFSNVIVTGATQAKSVISECEAWTKLANIMSNSPASSPIGQAVMNTVMPGMGTVGKEVSEAMGKDELNIDDSKDEFNKLFSNNKAQASTRIMNKLQKIAGADEARTELEEELKERVQRLRTTPLEKPISSRESELI